MGDRVSVSFRNGSQDSVVLFSHWGGQDFVATATEYCEDLLVKVKEYTGWPIGRLEPDTVMVDFIRFLTTGKDILGSDLYLGKDEKCGDNSDNGHYVFEFKDNRVIVIH